MRHRKASLKLNRTSSHRKAMFRNMVTSLFKYERIQTTHAKAKELRSWADHVITLAKQGNLHARRQALAIVREKKIVHKIFSEAGERFGNISGGYTRVIKLGRRAGDAAPISIIELVDFGKIKEAKKAKKQKEQKHQAEQTEVAASDKTESSSVDEPEKSVSAKEELKEEDKE